MFLKPLKIPKRIRTKNIYIFTLILFASFTMLSFQNCKKAGISKRSSLDIPLKEQSKPMPTATPTPTPTDLPIYYDPRATATPTPTPTGLPIYYDPRATATPTPMPTPTPIPPSQVVKTHSFRIQKQDTLKSVDILFVIDGSGSMTKYKSKLGTGFNNLFSSLSGIDWQLAVLPTLSTLHSRFPLRGSIKSGELVTFDDHSTFLTPSSINKQSLFINAITGLASESITPFCNIKDAMANPANDVFFRRDSVLTIIMLTDLQIGHCSNPRRYNEKNDLLNFINQKFGHSKDVVFHGIYPLRSSGWVAGPEIVNVIKEASGTSHDLHATDYTAVLNNLSSSLRDTVDISYVTLEHETVIEDSISLTFFDRSGNEINLPSAFSYQFDEGENSIEFNRPLPDEILELKISYRYTDR